MPADNGEVHSAAQINQTIEELIAFQRQGLVDVTPSVSRAILAFDECNCLTNADALAFIAMSRRIMQAMVAELADGVLPDPRSIEACERYTEMAASFLKMADVRDRVRINRRGSLQ